MIDILIPPVSDCFMPTLGAAQLVNYLRENQVSSKLYDLSAELQQQILGQAEHLSPVLTDLICGHASLIQRYEAITNYLFFLQKNGAARYHLTYDNFYSDWNWKNPDSKNELFLMHEDLCGFFCALPSFPELTRAISIGFSISYESQLIPSLLIAGLIKRENPAVNILFGGSFFYNYSEEFAKILYFFDLVDALIIGPGEKILCSIAQRGLECTASLGEFSVQKVGKHCILRAQADQVGAVVYEPDFSTLDFDRYLSRTKAFPYMIQSMCYYGGCKFCNGDRDCGVMQKKDVRTAFQHMTAIAHKTGIQNVYLVDAALSPSDLKALAEMPGETELFWIANGRFEHILDDAQLFQCLYRKGCRMLRFGLESGSQRVLNLMNKGTNLEIASRMLQKIHHVGILNHVYLMFGYWGETAEDRKQTLQFLQENKEYIDSYSVSIFQPVPQTQVYQELLDYIKSEKGDSEKSEYERMISVLYPSEEEYHTLLEDVETAKKILHSYAHTNGEYYSANIFSRDPVDRDKCRVNSKMLFAQDQPQPQLSLEKELWMRYEGDGQPVLCQGSIWDLCRCSRLHVEVPDWLWRTIAQPSGQIDFGPLTQAQRGIVREFLSEVSQYTVFCEPQIAYPAHRNFVVQSDGALNLGDMSIQFLPQIQKGTGGEAVEEC